ncbi:MAG TPA: glycosyltransferase [Chitinophagales bacterium]|nr:glycosyltransferase [Chitinophagales bacterium]
MITSIALIVFWFSVGLMFHSYVLYPALLKLFSAGKKENAVCYEETAPGLPPVYVVFAAYNEERVMQEKLESIYNTTYPADKLHVVIGSDNSTDRTNEIVSGFNSGAAAKLLVEFEGRNGKAAVLNQLVKMLFEKGVNQQEAVFILTDANVMFTPGAIYQLVKHFKNPDIGLVGANIMNQGARQDGISVQETTYIKGENGVKYLEGLNWGSMMGAFGACYAIKAAYWREIPPNYLMEDFYISMNVLASGKKAISEPTAICREDVSNEVAEEFKRKSRIQAGNFQNLLAYRGLLFRFDAVGFCFFSHKLIRWLGPVFIFAAYLTNVFLLGQGQFYLFTFILQNLLLVSPVIDALLKALGVNLVLLRFASYFYMMNLALVNGFIIFMRGVKSSAWTPTKRNI